MRAAALLLVLVPAVAVAEPYRWPFGDGDRNVSAYYDHGGVQDWSCGDNTYANHRGTDIAAVRFTQVYAAGGGWVKARADGFGDGFLGSTDGGGFGNHVAVFHGDGDETIYGHLSANTGIPALGVTVACGDPIGQSGTSGNSSGPHLHFETRVGVSETGSYYSGAADDPFAGACGGPTSFWTDQATDRPSIGCGDGTGPGLDSAAFVADVTIPDGTEVVAGAPFTKIWRLRNNGTTTWGDGYALIHVSGPAFAGGPAAVAAAPGEELEVAVTLTATGSGVQRSSWQVATGDTPFGEIVWVEVNVVTTPSVDVDGDGLGPGQDCDDTDASVYPGAEEACDGVDGDCDGVGDDGLMRACCDTGVQACAAGAWGACDVVCEEDEDEDGGGCSAGGGGAGALLPLGLMLALIASRGFAGTRSTASAVRSTISRSRTGRGRSHAARRC